MSSCSSLQGLQKTNAEAPGRSYESEVKALMRSSSGAELCATKENRGTVKPHSCVSAVDNTPDGAVDLTDLVVVGDPVKSSKGPNMWRVPYNVVDKAGNRADTVWRDIVVEELSFEELEASVRADVEEEKEKAVEEAVAKALKEQRSDCDEKLRRHNSGRRKGGGAYNNGASSCPACETCPEDLNGKDDAGLKRDLRACRGDLKGATDQLAAQSNGGFGAGGGPGLFKTLEELIPLFVLLILGSSALGLLILILQRIKAALLGIKGSSPSSAAGEDLAATLAKSVTYHSPRHGMDSISRRGPSSVTSSAGGASARFANTGTPRSAAGSEMRSPGLDSNNGIFSPVSVAGSTASSIGQSPAAYTLSPITPSRVYAKR